jgi:hypothetical protein
LFLAGVKSLEGDWASYLTELDALGWQEYIEIVQEAYDSQYK